MSTKQYRPKDETIQKVVGYLESIGLAVHGDCADLDTGEIFDSLMDYSADDAVKYRALCEADKLYDPRHD